MRNSDKREKSNADAAYDVIVVGSGGSGLAAALAAGVYGAKVLLLEATPKIGGTSVFSAGQVWVPNHHYMDETNISDSKEEALAYFRAMNPERDDETRWSAFINQVPKMILFLEAHTPLRFKPNKYPDSFVELEGGKPGGRNLEAVPYRPKGLGDRRRDLRYPPSINRTNLPLTWTEVHDLLHNTFRGLIKLTPRLLYRLCCGKLTGSRALVSGLYAGCLKCGVGVMLETRSRELLTREDEVIGVRAERLGKRVELRARGGVIIATGAFDWNEELKAEYLPGRIDYSAAIPSSRGDGLLMARQVNAKLSHMDEAWYWAGVRDPRYYYDGAPLGTLISNLRSYPHTIIVNQEGRRFGNEASHNIGNALQETDTKTGKLVNLPCWAVFDRQFRKTYNALEVGLHPFLRDPKWLARYGSLEALAAGLGIDSGGLQSTVERFNEYARKGKDTDFRRGEYYYDRCYGAPIPPKHPNLGTIEVPPFYAIEVIATSLGTKGGPMTNEQWQVMREDDVPVAGLYAVGNVSDCMTGPAFSGGDTLSMGMTAGYIAGTAAAMRAKQRQSPSNA